MNIYALSADVIFYERLSNFNGKIISVFLTNGTNAVNNFRCPNCGKIAFQYSGDVDSIYVGAKIIKEPIIDIMCHQCKIKFRVYQ